MKVARATKLPPSSPLREPVVTHHVAHHDSEQPTFLNDMRKRAGISRKELMYSMRVSKTTVDGWLDGKKADPIERARVMCALVSKRQPALIGVILLHIAGENYDGLILDPVKKQNLEALVEAIKK